MSHWSKSAGNYRKILQAILISWTCEKGKSSIFQKEMVPSAGYFKEFDLFIIKTAPNKFIFVTVKGKLQMSNPCFLEPTI